jgi:ribonucleotide reductase beta subunit family protein with ferritin-like domain
VLENLQQFTEDKDYSARDFQKFFKEQIYNEGVHDETYKILFSIFVPEKDRQYYFLNLLRSGPLQNKFNWINTIFTNQNNLTAEMNKGKRVIAQVIFEGIMFASAFALFIKESSLTNFVEINKYVARDETIHGDFFTKLYKYKHDKSLTDKQIITMFKEGLEIELEFIEWVLGNDCDSQFKQDLIEHIKVNCDMWLNKLGVEHKYFSQVNETPLQYMSEAQGLITTNFFERRPINYTTETNHDVDYGRIFKQKIF